jgi:hypothetical protein
VPPDSRRSTIFLEVIVPELMIVVLLSCGITALTDKARAYRKKLVKQLLEMFYPVKRVSRRSCSIAGCELPDDCYDLFSVITTDARAESMCAALGYTVIVVQILSRMFGLAWFCCVSETTPRFLRLFKHSSSFPFAILRFLFRYCKRHSQRVRGATHAY